MDKKTKKLMEDLYTHHCIMLSELSHIVPIFFIIFDKNLTPMFLNAETKLNFDQYTSVVINAADNMNADYIVLISEQYMVTGNKHSKDIKALMDGTIKPSEHPNKEEHLVLVCMKADGETHSLIGKIETDLGGTRFIREQSWVDNIETTLIVPWRKKDDTKH